VNGPISDGLQACHRCDNPPCCNPSHLFLGTPTDNARDREAKQRRQTLGGEAHGNAKLTAEQVAEIRRCVAIGRENTIPAIAQRFGVDRQTAWAISTDRTWA
jgi:hypothetical protein